MTPPILCLRRWAVQTRANWTKCKSISSQNSSKYLANPSPSFPRRPRNVGPTLPFSSLSLMLFNPLLNAQTKRVGPPGVRRKQGPWPSVRNPQQVKRDIIERFIATWREQVGPDIFPAFRLIVPERDKDRQVYGLKEKMIARILVKVLNIKNSPDAQTLLNWKIPTRGAGFGAASAGDFAGRVFDVVSKRAMRTNPGSLTIKEVNDYLDELSGMSKENEYTAIFKVFYAEMNAEEIMWVVRMILRQMKIGATEKTIFGVWHPDAEDLFKVTSSLRRVCWDLCDRGKRLESKDNSVKPMQIFQPQLAQFQLHDFDAMVKRMDLTKPGDEFWIEEKLDGERMQLHMVSDESMVGGKRFAFWSRRAKEYTYLYGDGFEDKNGSLTKHLRGVFDRSVEQIILDGEMVVWDPVLGGMAPFGGLKTAAIAEQEKRRTESDPRPMFIIFDILLCNEQVLTNYTLIERRKALKQVIANPVKGRFELHTYIAASTAKEIEDALRNVVAQASEGLVLKNPRTIYSLNDRNDNWMKVKPEYMTEYGEQLDVLVIGGYYGTGRRGGGLSSFLCGLRVDESQVSQGTSPMKCLSFFKVGGGFMVDDYKKIHKMTEDKWTKWDRKKPPKEYIELAGGDIQHERPDVWIRPDESVILAVKAASVSESDKFATGFSLRFPRFVKIREDRDWETALSREGFLALKEKVETEQHQKHMKVDDMRKQRKQATKRKKKTITISGQDEVNTPYGGPESECFKGREFFIMGGSSSPKKTKIELEQLVRANGGTTCQRADSEGKTICIADANLVQVNALRQRGTHNVYRPSWLLDCIKQGASERELAGYLLPREPKHMLFTLNKDEGKAERQIDPLGDSYARDTSPDELRKILDDMPKIEGKSYPPNAARSALESLDGHAPALSGWILQDLEIAFVGSSLGEELDVLDPSSLRTFQARQYARFAGADVSSEMEDGRTTHVVVCGGDEEKRRGTAVGVRRETSGWLRLPRVVGLEWVESCWREKTRVDEERFAV